MYDINYKNLRKSIYFMIPFFLFGIIFLVISFFSLLNPIMKKNSFDSKIEASHIDLGQHDSMYSPKYIYVVDGVTYICKSNFSSNIKPKIDQQYVYYDSENPSDCITDYSASFNLVSLLILGLPLLFITVSITKIYKTIKRIKKVKYLAQYGTLIKGLQYTLEKSEFSVNNVPIMVPAVDYTLPSGTTVHLVGDALHDRKYSDEDGLVDLLIDPADPTNYYIDLEINLK